MCIDKKWVKTKKGFELYVKNRKYNDKFYKFAYEIQYRDGFERCMQWYNAKSKDICDYVVRVIEDD